MQNTSSINPVYSGCQTDNFVLASSFVHLLLVRYSIGNLGKPWLSRTTSDKTISHIHERKV